MNLTIRLGPLPVDVNEPDGVRKRRRTYGCCERVLVMA